jgi:uncharacterized membrane protein
VILWIVLLGMTVGMRTMTAMAVLCWFAWSRLLPQDGWAFWTAYLVTAIVFTVMALGEYVGDTLPRTPSRTDPLLVGARLSFGALVGALAAHGIVEPVLGGILFGVIGALIGTYGGVRVRMYGARAVGRDLPVALMESGTALALALFACWQLHSFAVSMGIRTMRLGIFHRG